MRTIFLTFAAATALVVMTSCATPDNGTGGDAAATEEAAPEASIPFANFGAIRTWRPGPDDTLLLQSTHGQWYRATFFGSCPDIRFTEEIGVISDARGSVDRFSGILVRDRECRFRSLVEIADPAARTEAAPAATQ